MYRCQNCLTRVPMQMLFKKTPNFQLSITNTQIKIQNILAEKSNIFARKQKIACGFCSPLMNVYVGSRVTVSLCLSPVSPVSSSQWLSGAALTSLGQSWNTSELYSSDLRGQFEARQVTKSNNQRNLLGPFWKYWENISFLLQFGQWLECKHRLLAVVFLTAWWEPD